MLSKCRFKRQLLSPPSVQVATKTTTNVTKWSDLSRQIPQSLPRSRLRALMLPDESTHFYDYHPGSSFWSEALKISVKMGFLCEGKQLHGHLVKLGLFHNLYMQNQVMRIYFRCNEVCDAHKVLDEMSQRNVVVWNSVICAIFGDRSNHNLHLSSGFSYFRTMLLESARPDDITFNVLLHVCIASNDVEIGRQLHCFVVKIGFAFNCFVSSALVDLYAKCGLVKNSRRAFDEVTDKDLVLWNVMVYCYASNCLTKEAIEIFNLMQWEGVTGDEFTFTNLLSSFGGLRSCEFGKQIHGIVIRRSFDVDILVASALIHMYSKNENISDARKVFDTMSIRNIVSWNTVIVGYGKHGEGKEAVKLFCKMIREELSPDELTLASIISSCGYLGLSNELAQAHAYTIKFGFQSFLSANNALINSYFKCGSIVSAFQCFSLAAKRDLLSWTSIISGYAFHGLAQEATECYEKMLTCGINPDKVTFLGVLSSCSHGGLIDKGFEYFKVMTKKYQIVPDPEHYTCLIDLVGRFGLLDEALTILDSIPIEASANTFRAFLGACKVHGNLSLAEWAADKLFALEPNVAGNYTILSSMYSSEGLWSDVARVRKMMRRNCNFKSPGCSWVEIGGNVHTFVSSDHSHPNSEEVYAVLGLLFRRIKEQLIVWENSQTLIEECTH